jgi:tripartite-type tricarboxylate transporter receptor subunit TctC
VKRRQFIAGLGSAAAWPISSRVAWAQNYPGRPVRLIVGFAAGGATDIIARLIGQSLSDRLGQQFLVENRTGAGGNIGAEAVVHAPSDGYTLLVAGFTQAVNTTLYPKLNFDFRRDLTPIAAISREPNIVEVNPSIPVKSFPEFINYARAHPGLNMASAGIGTPAHMAGELFNMMAGVRMSHVPYRGGPPALTDLISGQVQVMFAAMSASLEYVRDGKLRPLAVTTASRSNLLPDVPAVAEFLPGFEVTLWLGLSAPINTPSQIVNRLNREVNASLADPTMKARLAGLGSEPLTGSPSDFAKLIADETGKWEKVIRFAGIKLE